jgi:hypothetical protein
MQSVPIITKSCSWRGVHDTTLYDKVCQLLDAGQWLSWGVVVAECISLLPESAHQVCGTTYLK